MSIKISSGWSKGLKILTPEGLNTRPTRERIRQSAINMLQPWVSGAKVLDLFAGSGAVGIELVSRGALGAVFLEADPAALGCLRTNTNEAAARASKQGVLLSPWRVEAGDAYLLIKSLADHEFDLIWADPPYDLVENFLSTNASHLRRTLAPAGIFALESQASAQARLVEWGSTAGFDLLKQRAYGVTLISIWQKN